MKENSKFETGKKYKVKENVDYMLDMFLKDGSRCFNSKLNGGEIVTLEFDSVYENDFMLVRDNGEISETIHPEFLNQYIEEINIKKDIKVDNKVVNEEQINYKDSYERLMEMYKELQQENEDLKKALVKIALKL